MIKFILRIILLYLSKSMYTVWFVGDQSDRGRVPVASSSELSLISAPVDAGLLAEGADGETELLSDPQRSQ